MKSIHGESFQIRLDETSLTLCFKGALRLTGAEDYASILEMLRGVLTAPHARVLLDIRELDFLNSSGIAMLSRFVIEARERNKVNVQFLGSLSVPWHARSLKNLQRLMPSLSVELA